ncbi:MAG: pro-sigmaK processing inhibitor BofA family protein [Defluviitaleaceae bacterium]|nr:pro-sigmaK processing inhibitor BofA family protein [Defluviitaleaceae bacterium]
MPTWFSIEIVLTILGIAIILFIPKLTIFLLKLLIQSVLGTGVIFALNFFLAPFGLFVGINIITMFIVGLLGIPGILSLYILSFII